MIGQLFRLYSLEISIIDIIRYNSYSTYSFHFSSTKMESYISSFCCAFHKRHLWKGWSPFLKSIISKLHSRLHLKLFAFLAENPIQTNFLRKRNSPFLSPQKTVKPPNLLQKKSISWSLPSNVSRALYRSLAKQKRLVSKPLDSKGAVQPRRFENSN